MSDSPTSHIIQSLVSNLVIAVSKGVAAVLSGSGAMLAETLHSFADCGNQLLLLLGVRQARRPPDAKHPQGYGRALYFWSFMVALLLFSGGGVFSIYEGLHKLEHPEPVSDITVGAIVLGISLLVEGWSTWANIKELNARGGDTGFFRYLSASKDSDLIVIFGENSAAVAGLVFALGAIVMARHTGDGRWDAVGSLLVGVVLVGVAVFLATEVKSLLVGESADPSVEVAVRQVAADDPNIVEVLRVLTIQQGPGEVVVAAKIRMRDGLMTADEVCRAINAFEVKVEAAAPDVRWLYIEPDIED